MSGRFSSGLNLASRERLYLLLEELGEAQQIIGKVLRHGYDSVSPFDPNHTLNRTLLETELGDILHAVHRMGFSRDVDLEHIGIFAERKARRVESYLHHQGAAFRQGARAVVICERETRETRKK